MSGRKSAGTRRVRIRGKWWVLDWRRSRELRRRRLCGECRWKSRVIFLTEQPDEREATATVVHEVLHACYPDLGEDAVIEGERAIVAALKAARSRR